MNLLGLLFLQYKDGRSLAFASKWMNWHGRVFLGRPEEKGLDWVREDLRSSYYWCQADRVLPTEHKALREWQEQSMFVAQFRNFEAKSLARIVSLLSLVLVLGIVGVGGVFDGTARAGSAMTGKIGSLFDRKADESQDLLSWCTETKRRIPSMTRQEQMMVLSDPRTSKCDALFKANP